MAGQSDVLAFETPWGADPLECGGISAHHDPGSDMAGDSGGVLGRLWLSERRRLNRRSRREALFGIRLWTSSNSRSSEIGLRLAQSTGRGGTIPFVEIQPLHVALHVASDVHVIPSYVCCAIALNSAWAEAACVDRDT